MGQLIRVVMIHLSVCLSVKHLEILAVLRLVACDRQDRQAKGLALDFPQVVLEEVEEAF